MRAAVVAPVSVVCPFKGLAPYDRDDAEFFFGRERLVATVIGRLAASPFVGVVGASGSGKSSIVQAGVVPSLENGALPGSAAWPGQRARLGDEIDPAARLIVVDPLEEAFAATEAEDRAAALGSRARSVEFQVDQNRNGVPWTVTLSRNGNPITSLTATTRAPSGSFEIHRVIAGQLGTDRITAIATRASGETCTAPSATPTANAATVTPTANNVNNDHGHRSGGHS